MHRYREYGLISEQDEVLRRAFRDGFKRVGLSPAQFQHTLAWYRDHARSGAGEAELADAFERFAADSGWLTEQRDGALDLYRAIRDGGPTSVMQSPLPDQDRAVLARADELLRTDPTRYWSDLELQDAVFEARERLDALVPQAGGAPATDGDRRRVDEIEAMLRDPAGDGQRRYWSDAGLRANYAQALTRLHDGGGSVGVDADAEGAAPLESIGTAP
jgi:hypothetical protein